MDRVDGSDDGKRYFPLIFLLLLFFFFFFFQKNDIKIRWSFRIFGESMEQM